MAKKVALVIAHTGYQHVEYSTPKNIIESAGFQVVILSNKKGTATADNKSKTHIDADIEHTNPEHFTYKCSRFC